MNAMDTKMNTKCHEVQELLTAYHLQELPPAQSDQVRQHLDECAVCRTAGDEIKTTLVLLQEGFAAIPAAAPERLDETHRQRVIRSRKRKPARILPFYFRMAALFAGVLTVASLAFYTFTGSGPHQMRTMGPVDDGEVRVATTAGNKVDLQSAVPPAASASSVVQPEAPQEARLNVQMAGEDRSNDRVADYESNLDQITISGPAAAAPSMPAAPVPAKKAALAERKALVDGKEALRRSVINDNAAATVGEVVVRELGEPAATTAPVPTGALGYAGPAATAAAPADRGAIAKLDDYAVNAKAKEAKTAPSLGVTLSRERHSADAKPDVAKDEGVGLGATIKNETAVTGKVSAAKAPARTLAVAAKPVRDEKRKELPALEKSVNVRQELREKGQLAAGVNPWVTTEQNRFSTFSIDVDTASYTMSRNYLNRGFLPPPEAVRVEEFVNFFDYAYPPPEQGTFAVYGEYARNPFRPGTELLKIGVKGMRLSREKKQTDAVTLHQIAGDVKIQVEFNPRRVSQYRQFGDEKRQLKTEDFRNDAVDAGEVGSGQSVTALYDLQLQGDDREPLATVRVRYRNLATGAIEEIKRPLTREMAIPQFDKADPRFRLAAGVAEFAELLRGSPYAAGSSFEEVAKLLRPVGLELNRDQKVQELLRLVQAAAGGLPRAEE